MSSIKPMREILDGQLWHCGALLALLYLLFHLSALPDADTGAFLGISTMGWTGFVIANAVAHQIYVWFCWRTELHGQLLTNYAGKKAFHYYAIGFVVLMALRPILAFALGWSNKGTLAMDPVFAYPAAAICFGVSGYLMYCVRTYFSFDRAFGIDHFDATYRDVPFVKRGIFRLTPNAMYVFGFLMLWTPAFLFQSLTALMLAGFSHAYIWVHYVVTERPDMKKIYG